MTCTPRAILVLLALPLAVPAVLQPGSAKADWPQLLGPRRDGAAAAEQQLAATWPETAPTLWTRKIGLGYAGPAIVGGRVLVFHREKDQNVLQAIRLADGEPIWRAEFPAAYRGGVNSDTGPRCTPVVDRDQVLVMSASGELASFELDTGKPRWRRPLFREFRAQEGYFGAGSTPVVHEDRILVNVGGRRENNSGIVALNRETGETLWTATDAGASYSSPILTEFDSQPCAVFVTRLTVTGLNPADGRVYFEFPYGNRGPAVNGATPLAFDGQLFVSSSYGVGARLVRLGGRADTVWENHDVLDSQYSTSIYQAGYLYGSHGREDLGATALRCVDAKTGKIRWSRDDVGVANLIRVGEELLVLEVETGLLRRVACDPKAYRELARTYVARELCRALPAISQGKLVLRTHGPTGGELRCLDL